MSPESLLELLPATPAIDPAQIVQQVLAALEPLPGKPITYAQIETALEAAGLDPYEYGESYQEVIEQLESLGAIVVDSLAPTATTVDQEVLALVEADEVEQLLKSILADSAADSHELLTAGEERRLLEIYADGQRARRELEIAQTDLHRHQVERRIHAGKLAYDELIRRNLRLVAANVLRYGQHVRNLDFEDLLQEGAIGLSRAIERFDLNLNMRLSTYATWWIRQAIGRAVADQDRTIRLPVYIVDRIRRLLGIERDLNLALGRRPTEAEIALELEHFSPNDCSKIRHCWERGNALPDELAQRLEHAVAHVRKLQYLAVNEPLSTDAPVKGEESSTLGDFIASTEEVGPQAEVFQAALHESLIKAMEDFPERSQRVLIQRFGLDDGESYTLEEIGQQLGLTRERIRQIEAKSLRRLKHPTRARGLRDFLEK